MNINHKNSYQEKVAAALSNAATPLHRRDDVVSILTAALMAADPQLAVKNNLRLAANRLTVGSYTYPLSDSSMIVCIALGKAGFDMLTGAVEQLRERYQGGVCVCKHLDPWFPEVPFTKYILGDHPIPGEGSLRAGGAIEKAVSGLGGDDLVLLLLSGGGSSLATLPVEGVMLADMQQLTGTLLRSGANIAALNTVRKHLDQLKGGGLVRLATPATVASLVLSDVVGNNLDVIASGPAYPDPTTFADALMIVQQASAHGDIPGSILHYLEKGSEGLVPETLKGDSPGAGRCSNTIIASNSVASAAAVEQARALGFHAEILTNALVGEARIAATQVVNYVKGNKDPKKPFMLIWGGETTVTVTGNGKGGRNQELALAAVREMAGNPDTLLLTLATDGEDGPTDAAGALVTCQTMERAAALGMNPDDYLLNNDAYSFFERLGDLLITGPTGTNVNDLTFVFGF